MYHREFYPFNTSICRSWAFTMDKRYRIQEFELMKSYYPRIVQEIQERVEEECRLLDYEGSRIYDEYPDKTAA